VNQHNIRLGSCILQYRINPMTFPDVYFTFFFLRAFHPYMSKLKSQYFSFSPTWPLSQVHMLLPVSPTQTTVVLTKKHAELDMISAIFMNLWIKIRNTEFILIISFTARMHF
jgi:hypothetical protein